MGCTKCGSANTNCNCNCPPNDPGPPGNNWAQIVTTEAPGPRCPYGGIKIQSGPDINNDGVPENIVFTNYLCNGAPGKSFGVRVSVEAPGVNCPNGGFKIEVGEDSNNNGIPDTNITTSYVCNGAAGIPGSTPSFVTGTVTTLAPGSPATASVRTVATNTYAIDIGVPQGSAGAAGSTLATGVSVNGVTVPTCLVGPLGSITDLAGYIQVILDNICNLQSTNMPQGNPGQFAARIDSDFSFVSPALTGLDTDGIGLNVPILNDSTNGCFDNGNNYNGARYIVPTGGFTGKFAVQDFIVEETSGNIRAFCYKIVRYNSLGVFTSVLEYGSVTIGAGLTKLVPGLTTAATVFSAGEQIALIIHNTTVQDGEWKIKELMFHNLAV